MKIVLQDFGGKPKKKFVKHVEPQDFLQNYSQAIDSKCNKSTICS